ncbi:hypothetical protein ACKWTF_011530 [Chironomus riparius]
MKKKGHKCDYDKKEHFDDCKPCKMTKDRRFAASKDKKNNYQKKKNFGHILNTEPSFGKMRKDQKCRKCANHHKIKSMKEHKNSCPYLNCPCVDCLETEKRRFAVKHEAKAKRQKNKNLIKQENDESMSSSPSSPNDSGYNSDLSSSSLKSHSSKYSLPSVYDSIPFFGYSNMKCEATNWKLSQTSSSPVNPATFSQNTGYSNIECKEETKLWVFNQSPNYSSSSINSGFFEPIPYIGHTDFKCKEEQNCDMNANTTDYYTNTSSNTFQEITRFPIKTEASELFVRNCTNFTADDSLLQAVVQGLLNNEFDIEEVCELCDDSIVF